MRLMIFFSILIFCGTSLNAAEITWVNAFPFYVYGDVSYIAYAYELVNIIISSDSAQIILGIGFSIATLIAGYQARLGGIVDITKSVIAPITLYALFAVPTVNVHITDLRVDKGLINHSTPDGGYRKVDDIPYAIAAIPTSVSMLVSVFIDLVDDSSSSIYLGSRFSTLGFQGISQLSKEAMIVANIENIRDVNGSSIGDTAYNLNQYVKHCMITKGFEVSKSNKHILTHPSVPFPDMWNPSIYNGDLANAKVTFDDGVDASGNPVDQATCSSLYTTYVSAVDGDIEDGMKELIEQRFPGINADDASLNEAYRDQIGDTANLIGNIGKAAATLSTTRLLSQALDTEGIGVNGVSYAMESSIQTTYTGLRTEGLAKFEWIARTLPDAITIILGIMIGAFPLMILVMSFFGKNAMQGIGNFFMGYVAINFNLVSLALVNNIISYYTAQHAQEAIVSYAGMPFGLTQVSDFMMQQADMAGFAGVIGAVSIFAVTPLIFKGETAGFSAAMSAIGGAYRGNVAASAQKELTDYATQAEIDKKVRNDRATTVNGMTEEEASAWLSEEGFTRPNNMSAVETYNGMMKNLSSVGGAYAAQDIFHAGNAQNFMRGSQAQSSQSMNKTAGFGGSVDMASAGSVAFEDGEVMGSMINKTADLRNNSESYNPNDVGEGQAIGQFGKDMGSALLSKMDSNANATVANASKSVVDQVMTGRGLLNTGAFNRDGTVTTDENGNAISMNGKMQNYADGVSAQSQEKFNSTAGYGSTVNADASSKKAFEDGARSGQTVNDASDLMFSDKTDAKGRPLYDRNLAAHGEALKELAGLQSSMQTAKAADLMTTEKDGDLDYIMGAGANARKAANDMIGVGEKFGKQTDAEQIADMAKVKENAAKGFFGGIRGTNAEIHANGRSVDDAIADDVALGIEKGTGSATHADNLKKKYKDNLKGSASVVSDEQREQAQQDKADAQKAIEDIQNQSSFTKNDVNKVSELENKIKAADATIGNKDSMTLGQVMSTIDQSKLDSQLGQASGINKNLDAGVNYAQNAMYGEMSKQQSTQAKLDAQGGVDGAVSVDVMEAGQKASQQKGAVEGLQSEAQKIGEEIGKSAAKVMGDTARTMASSKIATDAATIGEYDKPSDFVEAQKRDAIDKATKSKIMNEMANNSDAKNNVVNEEMKQIEATKGKQGVADYLKEGKEMGFLDKNGEASENADDWVRGRSTFSASGMNKNEQGVIAGARVSTAFNAMTGDAITNVDGVRKIEDGTSTNAHLGDAGNIESQRTREGYEHMMNPMSKGLPMLVGKSHDAAQEYFQSHGMTEENAGLMASVVTAGGAAVTAAGIVEAGTRIKNSVMGNHVATKSFEFDTGKTNADGDAIMKTIEKGEHFSTKNNSALGDYVKNNKVSKVERGTPRKLVDGMLSKGNSDSLFSNSKHDISDSSSNKTNDISTSTQNQSPDSSHDNKPDNKVQHNNSFSKDTNSIPKNGQTSNTSIAQQIETQGKYENTRTSMVEQNAKVNALNNGGTPEMLARQKMELNALDGAHNEYLAKSSKPNLDVPKKKMGFGGKFGTLLGLSMGGATIASAYDSSASSSTNAVNVADGLAQMLDPTMEGYNTMKQQSSAVANNIKTGNYSQAAYEAVSTPVKFAQNVVNSGMDFGKSLHGAYDNAFGGYTSVIDKSPAPQYAQNAFSTPSGFNTLNAMQTQSTYQDTTNSINAGAEIFKADASNSMVGQLEDINIGTEFNQEASEGITDAVERLSETLYKNKTEE